MVSQSSALLNNASAQIIEKSLGNKRRRHERFPAAWPIKIKLASGAVVQGLTENVSASGVLFTLGSKVEIGTRMYVQIESYSYGAQKTLDAVVSLAHSSLSKDMYRYGVEIIKMSEGTREFLSRYAKGKNPHLSIVSSPVPQQD